MKGSTKLAFSRQQSQQETQKRLINDISDEHYCASRKAAAISDLIGHTDQESDYAGTDGSITWASFAVRDLCEEMHELMKQAVDQLQRAR